MEVRRPKLMAKERLIGNMKGTHAKTQGVIQGKLIVPDDLPKHLKQSMFEHGGEYEVLARYSSEPGEPGLDVRITCPLIPDDQLRLL